MEKEAILVIGANGQIGTALYPKLQEVYGAENVVASDLRSSFEGNGQFEQLDATDFQSLSKIVSKYKVTQIYHLAAVLSAKAEADPIWAWNLNIQTLLNILEAGKQFKLKKLFIPSSIAVFGENAPAENTPQITYLDPSTVYGISKVATENWMHYYYSRFNVDVRSLRYPGVISYQSMPGGGTTDYAVDMYHKATSNEKYTCFLSPDTRLPMIYIDDVLRATLELMEAPAEKIKVRSSYNLAGLSFTPAELYESLKSYYPDFSCEYAPDFRQDIAASWPKTIDDSSARQDWGWEPEFNLEKMTRDMVKHLSAIPSLK
ncbi:NAD-dependent epimerase/dehydratase family protein [Rubrolithibacter danxiaensis]|uniref:NAD-dependent epimerase/dehydratase family protein n=1 Tax=Rubrolithibacter danxiaensis TaxID=3390805 RepID=UPI003BF8E73F